MRTIKVNLSVDKEEPLNLPATMRDVERWAVTSALREAEGNKTQAAFLLGLNRTTLIEKMRKFSMTLQKPTKRKR